MRIDRIHIEGFGKFRDREFGPLESPISVFLGANESGKSTLLQFIRTVLFGFPGRLNNQVFPPLYGGRHGGSINIVDGEGDHYAVSRFDGRGIGPVEVRDGHGAIRGEAFLGELLGGHGRDVFTNLFAFSLTELQEGMVLENEDVNRQIYSAGVGERNLPAATKRLDHARKQLFLPGGRNQRLAGIRRQIGDLEERLRKSSGQSRRHGQLVAELADLATEKQDIRDQIQDSTARARRIRRLAAARIEFNEIEAARGQLAELPEIAEFPESAIARLEAVETRLLAARRERDRAVTAKRRAHEELPELPADDPLEVSDPRVRFLVAGRSEFDSSVRSRPQREIELAGHRRALEAAAGELGRDWTPEQVSAFAVTAETRAQIAAFERRISAAEAELSQARAARRGVKVQLDSARGFRELQDSHSSDTGDSGTFLSAGAAALGLIGGLILIGAVATSEASSALLFGAVPCILLALVGTATYFSRRTASRRAAVDEVDRLGVALQSSEKAERAAFDARAEARAAWEDWLGENGLHCSFSPGQLGELRALAERARGAVDNVEAAERRISAIQRDIDEYAAIVKALAERAGIDARPQEPARVAATADELIDLVERIRASNRAYADACKALIDREREQDECERELADLLAVGDAKDSEQFRLRARIWDERTKLNSQIQQARARLKRHLDSEQTVEELCRDLADTESDLSAEELQVQNDLEDLNARLQDNILHEGSLKTELAQLAADEDSDHLSQQHGLLLGQMAHAAREWTVITLAEHLLTEARRRYESERKPAIIRTAQRVFANLTDGRYQQVVAPLGSDTIEVVESGRGRKLPDNLSRGTREQLFLALRFGLIRELNQQTPRLPVAVDEVLVNFDPERGRRAARELVKLAQTNQLLVFTCHPPTVEVFADAARELGEPQPAVIGLDPVEPAT